MNDTANVAAPKSGTADMTRTLKVLGAIYMLEHTSCRKRDCADCPDVMQEMYRSLLEDQDNSDPVQFQWGNGNIRVVVSDPLMLALESPAISKSLDRLYHEGFDIVYLTPPTREG